MNQRKLSFISFLTEIASHRNRDCMRFFLKKKSGFTPCKAEQTLKGMELQKKEAQKD